MLFFDLLIRFDSRLTYHFEMTKYNLYVLHYQLHSCFICNAL